MDYQYNDQEGGYNASEEVSKLFIILFNLLTNNPLQPGGRKKTETLTPVTIKQLNEAAQQGQGEFYVDGQLLNNIVIIGMVMKAERNMNALIFELEDGTGRITVKQWLDSEEETIDVEPFQYAKVYGQFRIFSEKKNINCFRIQRVLDHNEITTHILDSIYTHLYHISGANQSMQFSNNNNNNNYNNNNYNNNNNNYNNNQAYDEYQQPQQDQGLSEVQQAIIEIVKCSPLPKGASISLILSQLRMQCSISDDDVQENINFLVSEGYIYNTLDEFHFGAQ